MSTVNCLAKEDTTNTPFLDNGRYGVMTDSNGPYYIRTRYYNPQIGRFINKNVVLGSINNGQSLNRYAYVNGNPVSYIDPFGLSALDSDYQGMGHINNLNNVVVDNRKAIAKYVFNGKSYTVSGSALFDGGLVFDEEGIRPVYGGGASIPGFSIMESKGNAKTGWYLNGFLGIYPTGQVSLDKSNQKSYSKGISTGKSLGITVDYVGDPIFEW